MKKLFSIAILSILLIAPTSTAFAANHVSEIAVNKGGQSVAACAKMMNKGVSECVNTPSCASLGM